MSVPFVLAAILFISVVSPALALDAGVTHEDRIRALETQQQIHSIKIVQIEDRISRNDARIDDLIRIDIDHRLTQVETEFRIVQTLLGAIGLAVLGQIVYLLSNGRRKNGFKGP